MTKAMISVEYAYPTSPRAVRFGRAAHYVQAAGDPPMVAAGPFDSRGEAIEAAIALLDKRDIYRADPGWWSILVRGDHDPVTLSTGRRMAKIRVSDDGRHVAIDVRPNADPLTQAEWSEYATKLTLIARNRARLAKIERVARNRAALAASRKPTEA